MADALLLLPDFLLIGLGWALCRFTPLNRPVWDGAERLVYFVLFPALLFNAIVRSPMQATQVAGMAAAGLSVTITGIALALMLGRWPGVDPRLHASGAQTAYRFNSFIALAMAERLSGAPGVAWMALLMSLCVPLANVAAVWPLARQGGQGYWRALARNPLILATVSGLLCNLVGLQLPALATNTLSRIGAAAVPLGLMAVGAGLQMGALRESPGLAAALLGIRHVLLPGVAILAVSALALAPAQQSVVVVFASLPTSSAAYVLATRMGGHGGFVAGIILCSTAIGMVGLPLALAVLRVLA